MGNIILLFACLAIGVGLGHARRLPEAAHLSFNGFILHVSLPALILLQIHAIRLRPELLYSVAMPWLLFALGCGFFWGLGRLLGFSRGTTGGLMLVGGLANTSFVGLPMIEAFYGAPDMGIGILIDQLGTYLVLSTLGITVAAVYARGSTSAGAIVRRIATFPPLIALLLALALMNVVYPHWLTDVLGRLGATLVPLALVSVGLQLQFGAIAGRIRPLLTGLAFKLVIGPAVLAAIYILWLHDGGEAARVTLFEAAMGPQIGAAIVAIQNGLDPALISLMVGIGIALSFITLPAWWYVLQAV